MTARKPAISLPAPIVEADYPDGDGPAWVSAALGVPGCIAGVKRYLYDSPDNTTLILTFTNATPLVVKPAHRVLTDYLPKALGALGFPVPFYQGPQLWALGQAIGRIADAADELAAEDSGADMTSIVAMWLADCVERHPAYVLEGRAGVDVRAAIEHVRHHRNRGARGAPPVPLIVETARDVLLAWTVAVRDVIRDRLGTTHDADIGLALRRDDVSREKLAARPGPGQRGTQEIPVFVVPNGWHGLGVEIPDEHCVNRPTQLKLFGTVQDHPSRTRASARTHAHRRTVTNAERARCNGAGALVNYDALRNGHA